MSHDAQLHPDVAFLRNTGVVLLVLTLAVGGISAVGCFLVTGQSAVAQSAYPDAESAGALAMSPHSQHRKKLELAPRTPTLGRLLRI